MKVCPGRETRGVFGISGHCGAGHVHSHAGFVQDDSAGFAVVASLLKKAYPTDTTITEIATDLDSGTITVTLQDGGTGSAQARRGITPHESEIARRCAGLDAVFSQSVAFTTFGRIYGQGCLELPVALQTASCLAVIDTFEKKYPDAFRVCDEGMRNKIGKCLATVIDINDIPVSILGVLNANAGGLGPDEDLEGNISLGPKATLMREYGLDRLPTIILESKAYIPAISDDLAEATMLVRINGDIDNRCVHNGLTQGAIQAGVPFLASETAYPRNTGEMEAATRALGKRIAELGSDLASAETAAEKVDIVGKLALLISQDAGGISFMSSDLHDRVGGGGILPGTSAVLSQVIPQREIQFWKIPVFTPEDVDCYLSVIDKALPILANDGDTARRELEQRYNFQENDFLHLLR